MKTGKVGKKKRPSRLTKHHTAPDGLLNIAGKLKTLAGKIDTAPTWKEYFMAAVAKDYQEEDLLRAFHKQLTENHAFNDADHTRVIMAELAEEISVKRQDNDAEINRIQKDIDAAMIRHGKKPGEDWPEDQDSPEDLSALWDAGRHRANELMAAVLREYGEGDMADKLLTGPSAFWDWYNKGQDELQAPATPKQLEALGLSPE